MSNHKAQCPVCDADLTLQDVEVSEIINCNECKTRLVVNSLSTSTARVGEAPAVEEDWGQ